MKTTELTAGRLLARNAAWNLASQALPIAVAIVSMPILIRGMGTDRFGLLTLAWMVLGFSSLFDLGLGILCSSRRRTAATFSSSRRRTAAT